MHNVYNFMQEHLAGMTGMLLSGLVPARWSAGANTNLLRLFLLEVILLSCLMMASHRWSHTQAADLHPLIVGMQQSGVLVSHIQHSLHHVDYNCNFAIFTGGCRAAARAGSHLAVRPLLRAPPRRQHERCVHVLQVGSTRPSTRSPRTCCTSGATRGLASSCCGASCPSSSPTSATTGARRADAGR